jgi:hypothetical protein
MSIVQLKNVEVTRLNNSGTGFGVKEENTSNGKTYTTYWSIWPKDGHQFQVGQRINVSGFLSTKVGDPKTGTDGVERRYVELSINSPRFDQPDHQSPAQTPPAPAQSAAPEPWASDLPTPF